MQTAAVLVGTIAQALENKYLAWHQTIVPLEVQLPNYALLASIAQTQLNKWPVQPVNSLLQEVQLLSDAQMAHTAEHQM